MTGQSQMFEITHLPSGQRIRIALTLDQNGRDIYILSTDVTAKVQSRKALTHAAKRALAAQLTSGLAHDFGNLLTIILGLQARLARTDLPEGPAQDVQATLAATRRGVTPLDGIAALTGQREYHPQPVDLAQLLAALAAMTDPTLGKGVTLDIAADLPAGRRRMDPGALQDALLNLILNACYAMAGVGAILIGAHPAGRWLEIIVTDTGPGFSRQALARGTEPFFATKGGQGSGLGLAMVHDQIKLAGGTLRLSNAERGARVTIRLPLRLARPHLVLLAEDDDAIRAQIREMLTAQGHAVIEAGSLAEARNLTDRPGLTLVLSDLQLGDGSGADLRDRDGLALVNRLARDSGAVIIISGQAQDRVTGLELGADDYIIKPLEPAEVVARIRARLRKPQRDAAGRHQMRFAGWTADFDRYALTSPEGVETPISHAEAEVLRMFLDNPRRLISRAQLLEVLGAPPATVSTAPWMCASRACAPSWAKTLATRA